MGDDGPAGVNVPGVRERVLDDVNVIEEDLGGSEKEASGDGGCVKTRARGCCRILLRPDAPSPCSYSDKIGDNGPSLWSFAVPSSKENRILAFPLWFVGSDNRFPVLRFFGRLSGTFSVSASSCKDTERCRPVSSVEVSAQLMIDRKMWSDELRHGMQSPMHAWGIGLPASAASGSSMLFADSDFPRPRIQQSVNVEI